MIKKKRKRLTKQDAAAMTQRQNLESMSHILNFLIFACAAVEKYDSGIGVSLSHPL